MNREAKGELRYAEAEASLAEYFAKLEGDEELSLDHWCDRHPEIACELRVLHEEYLELQRAIEETPLPTSGQSTQTARPGENATQAVKSRVGPADDVAFCEALFSRLREPRTPENDYTVQERIARGGMGDILLVHDKVLHRDLAMKVIRERDSMPTDIPRRIEATKLARFLEEAQVMGQLDHPGIVPVHELGLDRTGRVYFTMKLVKGRTLRYIFDLVADEKEGWTQTRALGVLLKVCEAMAYAHSQRVIHRDIKPANVMVGKFGEVYVMDWGLARLSGEHARASGSHERDHARDLHTDRDQHRGETPESPMYTRDGDVIGTPAYMPPEQAFGRLGEVGPHSDVYAVGAMLYELLAGHPPYAKGEGPRTHIALLQRVLAGPPESLGALGPHMPQELVAICDKAMAREWRARYRDMSELSADLAAFVEGRVVRAYQAGAWAEARKWVERNKPLAASLAAAIVILVAGVIGTSTFAFDAKQQAKRADEKTTEAEHNASESKRLAAAEARARHSAQQSEAHALEQQSTANRRLKDVLSLSAIQELKELVERADALWPAFPDNIAEYDRWLEQAKVLVDGRPADPARGVERHPSLKDHEAMLAEIRLRGRPPNSETRVSNSPTSEFNDAQVRWWYGQLSQLVSDLKAFTDEKTGLFSEGTSELHGWGLVKRRKEAATVEDRSVSGADARERWTEATTSIAKSGRYGGLKLTPQLGLLPIGEDPDSHLWEFAHLASGEPPQRGADGKLVLTDEMGLVFVLIPAGTFAMGAQMTDTGGQNYDRQAADNESPVKEVMLSAFFLSKYEMTQGQWMRLEGRNPSYFGPSYYARDGNRESRPWSALHPVEQVSWSDCTRLMQRMSMLLPTEAQWEYSCRARTTGAYWSGDMPETLREVGNVADAYAKAHGGYNWSVIHGAWDDGNAMPAEVGSYRPNNFGLYDVHGNVWEWCRDGWGSYDLPIRPGDGERLVIDVSDRVYRGGSFIGAASLARSALRVGSAPVDHGFSIGLRPARAITL